MQYILAGIIGYFATKVDYFSSLIFHIILLLTPFKIYRFTSSHVYADWLHHDVKISTHISNNFPYGYIMGKNFIGYSDYDGSDKQYDTKTCTLITTQNYADYIVKKGQDYNSLSTTYNSKSIYIVLMYSQYNSPDYFLKNIKITYQSNIFQEKIIKKTVECFVKKKHSVIYISGKPGVGKSMTSMLIAKKLDGILITGFDPLTTHYNYTQMLSSLKRNNNHVNIDDIPFILQLDEIDKVIENIENPPKESNYQNKVMFKSKGEWNGFFDLIDRGIYQNLIVVMTSNKKISDITKDESLFRKGRIDENFELVGDHRTKKID